MKKIIYSFFSVIIITGCTPLKDEIDVAKEEEAIIAVIEEETDAFRNRDFDRLAATLVQDKTNTRLAANKSGYSYYAGWGQISSRYKEYFQDNPEPMPGKHVKTNYQIKVYEESAWSLFDELVYGAEGEVTGKNVIVRFLEKVEGEWKIVYLSYVSTSSYEDEEDDGDEDEDK